MSAPPAHTDKMRDANGSGALHLSETKEEDERE